MALEGRLALLAAAFLFSTGGAAIKASTLTAWPLASLRCLVASLALVVLMPEARRGWTWRLLPLSFAYAATLLTFAVATKLTTSANAIFLQSTAPLYLLVLSPLLLREKIAGRDLALGAVIAGGMSLFFLAGDAAQATAPNPVPGNWIGAASGLFWALTVAGLRHHRASGVAVVAMGNLLGGVLALAPAWPLPALTLADTASLLYLGIFQIGLAYVCLTRGLRTVPAFEASALLLLEPALNPVWTFLLHGERPASLALLGGALILAATLVQGFTRRNSAA